MELLTVFGGIALLLIVAVSAFRSENGDRTSRRRSGNDTGVDSWSFTDGGSSDCSADMGGCDGGGDGGGGVAVTDQTAPRSSARSSQREKRGQSPFRQEAGRDDSQAELR